MKFRERPHKCVEKENEVRLIFNTENAESLIKTKNSKALTSPGKIVSKKNETVVAYEKVFRFFVLALRWSNNKVKKENKKITTAIRCVINTRKINYSNRKLWRNNNEENKK